MAQSNKFAWVGAGAAAVAVIALAMTFGLPDLPVGSAQNKSSEAHGPLISRGYTDAPAGTAIIAGDPVGGAVLSELRIKNGQAVKRDEIIAVLNNYAIADVEVRRIESEIAKARRQRETMVSGYRTAEIALQEVSVKTAAEESRLKDLELSRSSVPPDQKQIQSTLSQQTLEREQAKLKFQKEVLAADLAQTESSIAILETKLDEAKVERELALVRSPLDGVVVDIYTRQGERISGRGIVKIVDLNQIRIFADVDELHLRTIKPGGKVEFTFQGSRTVHVGTITRTPLTVKRTKRSEADFGESNARLVEVEIKPDDPQSIPQMLGREARVIFQ
ncbi:HlyD family efflux transporter periplasmic adaptor subunit [Reyranella sp. MMS21-HV4-11]|jgi:multidrug efflux pump subunit AcrA (membrane-fusion protein)|uniref:HlyD family efflux transporter periplasmic adaptor subunit n=1 Tax=Reyranella humidisoli TaxID=2849149 RepID=A0ABS6IMU0_9HYPH|nr:HlyD family efflux transporter periplasmic adaptor subunit [Reyranella sp. MMS21-HV4-11]MBU8875911.1 HlyD family efflux transporter periplasmic adaptor subunit [Reyranella sp. MMS21-HV4-11]